MAGKFDRIVIAVPDFPAAVEQYQLLFGVPPFACDHMDGAHAAWWDLSNTVIELVQCPVVEPCIQGIVFDALDTVWDERMVANTLGVDIRLSDGRATAEFRRLQPAARCVELSVDHVVLRTGDAQACIELISGQLGVRLALDKTVPEWGGRMLFFRAGKLTLEVIETDRGEVRGSFFWGLAYQCQDLASVVQKLGERGIAVSSMREGRKPGTLVATLKSHCLEIPTLLIQPAR